MCNTFRSALGRLFSFAVLGVIAAALAAGPAWAQDEKKEPGATDAKQPAKDEKDTTKEAAKEATRDTKDTAKDGKDTAKDTAKSTKDTAKDSTKDSAKDATRTRDRATGTAKDAADSKDRAKSTTRSARDTARDTAKDARNSARDTARDTRREVDRDAPTLRDARDGRDVRDQRDALDDPDARELRNQRDTRDTRDVRDRTDIRDRTDVDLDARDVRDRRDLRDRETVRDVDINRRDVRTDVRTRRDVSRTRIDNFRAESVTARDLGVTFGRAVDRGLVIEDLPRTAVLANIGFRRGDVIVAVDDHRVRSDRDFVHFLFDPDLRHEVVTIVVLRDGREVPIEVRPATIIEEIVVVHDDFNPLHHFGIVVDERRPDQLVVVRVIPNSPAFAAGIRVGDVITTFHGSPVRGRQEFVRVLETVEPGEVAIQVNRNRQVRDVMVEMPPVERRTTGVRRSAARPDFDVDRPAIERREERRENRIERREERRDGPQQPVSVPVEPAPAQPARPLLPRLFR